jgi:hypothetical protein
LPLAAGQFVRIAVEELLGRAQTRLRQRDSDPSFLPIGHTVNAQTLGDGFVDAVSRVERARWILQHQLDRPAVLPQRFSVVAQRRSVHDHSARRRAFEPEQCPR